MSNYKGLAVIGLMLSLFSGGICSAATAPAAQKSGVSTIGTVDVRKIYAEYDKKKQRDAELKTMANGFKEQLEYRGRNALLTEAEGNELVTLKFKEKPTEKEKARVAELENLEKSRYDQLSELQTRKSPTDDEKKKLAELQQAAKQTDQMCKDLYKQYLKQVEDKKAEMDQITGKEILAAIDSVGAEKGIDTVVDKVAVLRGGTEITDPVIAKLNKK